VEKMSQFWDSTNPNQGCPGVLHNNFADHFHSYTWNVGTRNPANFDYSINQTNKSTLLPSSRDINPDNETQEPSWYVREAFVFKHTVAYHSGANKKQNQDTRLS
jgi:hypothetical protein